MSLEEKIGQLIQVHATMLGENGVITGPTGSIPMDDQTRSLLGSVLGADGAEKLIALQKEQMARQPHHIPMLFMYDIINGHQTIFPIPLSQSCSFRPDLVENAAHIAAKESAVSGLHVTFSPMLDLVRDARWGRVMESPGEDPYLNTLMARAMVRGYQGKDLKETGRIAACLKHLAGSVSRPVRMLKGFEKITLQPGQSRQVTFEIREDMLRFYDVNLDYTSEPGLFEVHITANSALDNKAVFRLTK